MTSRHSVWPPSLTAVVSCLSPPPPFLGNCCFEGCARPAGDPRRAGQALQVQLPLAPGPEQSAAGGEAPGGSGHGKLRFHPGQRDDGKRTEKLKLDTYVEVASLAENMQGGGGGGGRDILLLFKTQHEN